jgi:hypothetical protein
MINDFGRKNSSWGSGWLICHEIECRLCVMGEYARNLESSNKRKIWVTPVKSDDLEISKKFGWLTGSTGLGVQAQIRASHEIRSGDRCVVQDAIRVMSHLFDFAFPLRWMVSTKQQILRRLIYFIDWGVCRRTTNSQSLEKWSRGPWQLHDALLRNFISESRGFRLEWYCRGSKYCQAMSHHHERRQRKLAVMKPVKSCGDCNHKNWGIVV